MDYNKIKQDISAGSQTAYGLLYKQLYRGLCNYAYNIIPDTDVVEDLVQATFITLWENRGECSRIDYLKSYLYRCVYTACLKRLEHQKVRQRYYNENEYQLKQIQFETFESSYDDDLMGQLHQAIDLLPEKNREVVKLRFIEGLNTNEVSQRLDITPRTVETHVSKALRFLREKMVGVNVSVLVALGLSVLKHNTSALCRCFELILNS